MAELTLQQISETGGAATYVAATSGDGDTADNNGNMFLHIKMEAVVQLQPL